MESKRLYRLRDDRMIAGVCSGLARYFELDATIVRLLFVLGFFFGVSATLWIYIVLALIVPEEPYIQNPLNPIVPPQDRTDNPL